MTNPNQALLSLAARAEEADADEQQARIASAATLLRHHGLWPAGDGWIEAEMGRFFGFLNVGAYESAAMTLIGEGCWIADFHFVHPDFRQTADKAWFCSLGGPVTWVEPDGFPEPQFDMWNGHAATPALALTAACLRALSHGDRG